MTTNAIARRGESAITLQGVDIMELGRVLSASGYFKDARDASQAVVKVLYGQEVGIGPVTAMMGIHVIEGRPALSANLIAARVKSSGRYDYRVREHSAEVCRIEFFERDAGGKREALGVVEWSMADARTAGLGGRGPWKNYPRAMLFARAISEGARVHCPEIFGGASVYTPEELGAEVDGEGNVLQAVAVGEKPAVAQLHVPSEAQAGFLRNLLGSHVWTDEERAECERQIEEGFPKPVSRVLDAVKAELAKRKAAEDQYTDEVVATPIAEP